MFLILLLRPICVESYLYGSDHLAVSGGLPACNSKPACITSQCDHENQSRGHAMGLREPPVCACINLS